MTAPYFTYTLSPSIWQIRGGNLCDLVDLIALLRYPRDEPKLSREFHTIAVPTKGKRITALSHGIGSDNIEIVV